MIPKIDIQILPPIVHETTDSEKRKVWIRTITKRLVTKNPVIAEYLRQMAERDNNVMVGLMVYKMIENQMEVNQLNEEV